jgi:hypothetical protein
MRDRSVFHRALNASIALGAIAAALPSLAAEPAPQGEASTASLYRLIDSTPLISARRPAPGLGARLEGSAWLAPRHELRLSSAPLSGADYAQWLDGVSFATLSSTPTLRLDAYRATYRYTFLERRDWQWKVGVTANLRAFDDLLRPGLTFGQRLRLGSPPQVHLAGEGRLSDRWRLSFDADSPTTLRGRSLDLGLRVSYSLSPNFSLYGGYRLTDPAAEGDDTYTGGLANSANVGMRLRF